MLAKETAAPPDSTPAYQCVICHVAAKEILEERE